MDGSDEQFEIVGPSNSNLSNSSIVDSTTNFRAASSSSSNYVFNEVDSYSQRSQLAESELRKIILTHIKQDYYNINLKIGHLKITRVQNSIGYIYNLKTMIQSITRRPFYVPLISKNQIQNPSVQLNIQPPFDFVDDMTTKIKLANTEDVRDCFACGGLGQETCKKCTKSSHVICTTCYGRCLISCSTCKSYKKLIHFISQKYNWNTLVETYIHSPTDILTKNELTSTTGYMLLDETNDQVQPLREEELNCQEVVQFSIKSIESKQNLPSNISVVKQNQNLTGVPIILVEITYKKLNGTYAIFGEEKIVKTIVDVFSKVNKLKLKFV